MDYAYKLSICMMVKDEEKNLGRCLDSLKPLLDRPDVELIVVDTGSKDNTPQIAREYTEKVFFHAWNNNFSEMRNISISYARGKWIMYIDADEVLINGSELYELLCDRKCDDFNTILVKIKSYSSLGKQKMYTVNSQPRVIKHYDGFRFEGAVHNQPKCRAPFLNSNIYFDHYGYLFGDRELKERKFQRTGTILKNELEKNPGNIYYRYQLARSYNAHGDKVEALEEIRTAYKALSKDPSHRRQYLYVYGEYAKLCCENNKFSEAVEICRQGIEVADDYVDLHYILAFSLLNLKRISEAAECYEKYMELADNFDKLKISSDGSIEMYYLSQNIKDKGLSHISAGLCEAEDFAEAYRFACLISDLEVRIPILVKILLRLKKFDELRECYDATGGNKELRENFIKLIEEEKKSLNHADKKSIEQALSNGDDPYALLNRFRISGDETRRSLANLISGFDGFNEFPCFYAEIFQDVESTGKLMLSVLKKLKSTKVKQFVLYLLDRYPRSNKYFLDYLQAGNIRDTDFQSIRAYLGIAYVMLVEEAKKPRMDEKEVSGTFMDIFNMYVDRGIKYTAFLYNLEKLRLYYSTIDNDEDRFFIAMHFAKEAVARNDKMAGIKHFREALKASPHMACYMNYYKTQLFQNADEV